jgi:hypothetical protein
MNVEVDASQFRKMNIPSIDRRIGYKLYLQGFTNYRSIDYLGPKDLLLFSSESKLSKIRLDEVLEKIYDHKRDQK